MGGDRAHVRTLRTCLSILLLKASLQTEQDKPSAKEEEQGPPRWNRVSGGSDCRSEPGS